MANISRSKTRVRGFEDPEMDFQLIRQLGSCSNHASSVGECLAMASRIQQGEPTSWVDEFEALAIHQRDDANKRLSLNHRVSAKNQFLKACNSFRAAEYYSPCGEKRHRELGIQSRECFLQAMALSDYHFEQHAISFNNIKLPCYFISPQKNTVPNKTILIVSGFDGTLEEEFIFRGQAALERSYNVVLFAGPGQMDVFRDYPHTAFEPDFESPVKSIIDFLETRDDVDSEHLALMGLSFGGYFATRATAFEPRIKSLIANSPILDLYAYLAAFTGMDPARDLADSDDFSIQDLPHIPENEMPNQVKAQSEHLMRRFGSLSFKQTFIYLKQFTLGNAVDNIKIPCLALCGDGEGGEPMRQFKLFCQKANADEYLFSAIEGADTHCQVGNIDYAAAVMFDWLDEQLKA